MQSGFDSVDGKELTTRRHVPTLVNLFGITGFFVQSKKVRTYTQEDAAVC